MEIIKKGKFIFRYKLSTWFLRVPNRFLGLRDCYYERDTGNGEKAENREIRWQEFKKSLSTLKTEESPAFRAAVFWEIPFHFSLQNAKVARNFSWNASVEGSEKAAQRCVMTVLSAHVLGTRPLGFAVVFITHWLCLDIEPRPILK